MWKWLKGAWDTVKKIGKGIVGGVSKATGDEHFVEDITGTGESSQRHQNEITREREDNALQRKRADAEAAGINPIFAMGEGGQGAPASAMAGGNPSIGNKILDKMNAKMIGIDLKSKKLQNEEQYLKNEAMKKSLYSNNARTLTKTKGKKHA